MKKKARVGMTEMTDSSRQRGEIQTRGAIQENKNCPLYITANRPPSLDYAGGEKEIGCDEDKVNF